MIQLTQGDAGSSHLESKGVATELCILVFVLGTKSLRNSVEE